MSLEVVESPHKSVREQIATVLVSLVPSLSIPFNIPAEMLDFLSSRSEFKTPEFEKLYNAWFSAKSSYDDYGFYDRKLQNAYLKAERELTDYYKSQEIIKSSAGACRMFLEESSPKVEDSKPLALEWQWPSLSSALTKTVLFFSTINAAAAQPIVNKVFRSNAENVTGGTGVGQAKTLAPQPHSIPAKNEQEKTVRDKKEAKKSPEATEKKLIFRKNLLDLRNQFISLLKNKIAGFSENPAPRTKGDLPPVIKILLKKLNEAISVAGINWKIVDDYIESRRDLNFPEILVRVGGQNQHAQASYIMAYFSLRQQRYLQALAFMLQAKLQDESDLNYDHHFFQFAMLFNEKLREAVFQPVDTKTLDEWLAVQKAIDALIQIERVQDQLSMEITINVAGRGSVPLRDHWKQNLAVLKECKNVCQEKIDEARAKLKKQAEAQTKSDLFITRAKIEKEKFDTSIIRLRESGISDDQLKASGINPGANSGGLRYLLGDEMKLKYSSANINAYLDQTLPMRARGGDPRYSAELGLRYLLGIYKSNISNIVELLMQQMIVQANTEKERADALALADFIEEKKHHGVVTPVSNEKTMAEYSSLMASLQLQKKYSLKQLHDMGFTEDANDLKFSLQQSDAYLHGKGVKKDPELSELWMYQALLQAKTTEEVYRVNVFHVEWQKQKKSASKEVSPLQQDFDWILSTLTKKGMEKQYAERLGVDFSLKSFAVLSSGDLWVLNTAFSMSDPSDDMRRIRDYALRGSKLALKYLCNAAMRENRFGDAAAIGLQLVRLESTEENYIYFHNAIASILDREYSKAREMVKDWDKFDPVYYDEILHWFEMLQSGVMHTPSAPENAWDRWKDLISREALAEKGLQLPPAPASAEDQKLWHEARKSVEKMDLTKPDELKKMVEFHRYWSAKGIVACVLGMVDGLVKGSGLERDRVFARLLVRVALAHQAPDELQKRMLEARATYLAPSWLNTLAEVNWVKDPMTMLISKISGTDPQKSLWPNIAAVIAIFSAFLWLTRDLFWGRERVQPVRNTAPVETAEQRIAREAAEKAAKEAKAKKKAEEKEKREKQRAEDEARKIKEAAEAAEKQKAADAKRKEEEAKDKYNNLRTTLKTLKANLGKYVSIVDTIAAKKARLDSEKAELVSTKEAHVNSASIKQRSDKTWQKNTKETYDVPILHKEREIKACETVHAAYTAFVAKLNETNETDYPEEFSQEKSDELDTIIRELQKNQAVLDAFIDASIAENQHAAEEHEVAERRTRKKQEAEERAQRTQYLAAFDLKFAKSAVVANDYIQRIDKQLREMRSHDIPAGMLIEFESVCNTFSDGCVELITLLSIPLDEMNTKNLGAHIKNCEKADSILNEDNEANVAVAKMYAELQAYVAERERKAAARRQAEQHILVNNNNVAETPAAEESTATVRELKKVISVRNVNVEFFGRDLKPHELVKKQREEERERNLGWMEVPVMQLLYRLAESVNDTSADYEFYPLLGQYTLLYRLHELQLFLLTAFHYHHKDKTGEADPVIIPFLFQSETVGGFATNFWNLLMHSYHKVTRKGLLDCVQKAYCVAGKKIKDKVMYDPKMLDEKVQDVVCSTPLFQELSEGEKDEQHHSVTGLLKALELAFKHLVEIEKFILKDASHKVLPHYQESCRMLIMIIGEIDQQLRLVKKGEAVFGNKLFQGHLAQYMEKCHKAVRNPLRHGRTPEEYEEFKRLEEVVKEVKNAKNEGNYTVLSEKLKEAEALQEHIYKRFKDAYEDAKAGRSICMDVMSVDEVSALVDEGRKIFRENPNLFENIQATMKTWLKKHGGEKSAITEKRNKK